MAIYYIDPHTTTNGTGTWASPWSFASATRTGLTSGDEIRIKGVALTSLLTATSYTATITSKYQLTITAGGGLGADFVAYNVVYIPQWDAFFKISAVSGNVISIQSTYGYMPILNTSVTSITIQKVDTTTYPVSFTTSAGYLQGETGLTNITVSDCWIADGTRVTDGSVKTLINNSYTSSSLYLYLSGTDNKSCTFNLQNTHFISQNSASYQGVSIQLNTSNSTYNINQISCVGWNQTSWNGCGFTGLSYDDTINVTLLGGPVCGSAFYGSGTTFNITSMHLHEISTMIGASTTGVAYYRNLNINITDISYNSYESWGNGLLTCSSASGVTLNLNGVLDCFTGAAPQSLMFTYGDITLNFGSSFISYRNKRASTNTSVSYRLYGYGTPAPAAVADSIYIPNVPTLPTGWTSSYDFYYWALSISTSYGTILDKIPVVIKMNLPKANSATSSIFATRTGGYNCLLTHRDGTAAYEVLSPMNGYVNSSYESDMPKVTLDSAIYRTAGPSFNSYLATRNSANWKPGASTKAYKTIKIPVTSGVSYTVTGYIRTDDASYVNGDCAVYIVQDKTILASQNMTTACYNSWEQFTLSFTATQTREVIFSWGMYYENGAKSYWLDDLTVS